MVFIPLALACLLLNQKIKIETVDAVVTVYTTSLSENGGNTRTASGTKLREGIAAIDSKHIPFGTKIYIPSIHKTFIAEDTGGNIKDTRRYRRIDLCASRHFMRFWGKRKVKVILVYLEQRKKK